MKHAQKIEVCSAMLASTLGKEKVMNTTDNLFLLHLLIDALLRYYVFQSKMQNALCYIHCFLLIRN